MSQLANILRYHFAGANDKDALRKDSRFVKALESTGCWMKDDIEKAKHEHGFVPTRLNGYKALIQTEADAVNNSTLVQEEVMNTIVEGTEPFRVFRQALPIINAKSYSMRILKGETGTYADQVAEAGAIPIHTQAYTKQDISIERFGTRPVITKQLIEDGLFDVVEAELRKAGARMENALNRFVLDKILNGTHKITTNSLNPAGTHISVSDIARAAKMVKKYNYLPDTLLTHPTAEGYLLQDSNLAYVAYAGTPGPLTTGVVPKLMGLTPYTCTATDSASPTWDDTTAGSDVTAIVYSKADLGLILMRQDLSVEQYDDPIHDLMGISCLMRFGADVVNETSGTIIYHK